MQSSVLYKAWSALWIPLSLLLLEITVYCMFDISHLGLLLNYRAVQLQMPTSKFPQFLPSPSCLSLIHQWAGHPWPACACTAPSEETTCHTWSRIPPTRWRGETGWSDERSGQQQRNTEGSETPVCLLPAPFWVFCVGMYPEKGETCLLWKLCLHFLL